MHTPADTCRRLLLLASLLALVGCSTGNARQPSGPAGAYRFVEARELVRPGALKSPPDEDVLLDTARLGMAALADGDTTEAIDALERAYEIQESGGVNDPGRAAAATVIWEGVKVWKGEPFEQAATNVALAIAYALRGDWENVRIASRAANRRLADYIAAREGERVMYGRDDAPVETDYTAAWLLQAIADRALGESAAALDAVASLDPNLEPLTQQIRDGAYDTVVIVDIGLGPAKRPTGNDAEDTVWVVRDPPIVEPLIAEAPGFRAEAPPASQAVELAAEHRWRPGLDARQAKSGVGTGLVIGGAVVNAVGDSDDAQIVGLGLMLAGLLTKATAAADARYNDLIPTTTYIALLDLPGPTTLRVRTPHAGEVVLPDVRPGATRDPAVVYLRLFPAAPPQPYFTTTEVVHPNDHVPPRVGDYPYILGGTCVATPTPAVLATYQNGGYLTDLNLAELRELYNAERITLGSGPTDPGDRRHETYRHVLEGGRALYTPAPYTLGYKRLMTQPHAPYQPTSARVRELAARIRTPSTQGASQ